MDWGTLAERRKIKRATMFRKILNSEVEDRLNKSYVEPVNQRNPYNRREAETFTLYILRYN